MPRWFFVTFSESIEADTEDEAIERAEELFSGLCDVSERDFGEIAEDPEADATP